METKIMRVLLVVRLVLVFAVASSLGSLSAVMSTNFNLPGIRFAKASAAPCPTFTSTHVCSEYWVPAGPEMDTLVTPTFSDVTAEYLDLRSPNPSIDLTDSPVPSTVLPDCVPPAYYYTAPTAPGMQFCYLHGSVVGGVDNPSSIWQRVVNDESNGVPNHFTWLNAQNPQPTVAGTIRQSFTPTTRSVNPYVASTPPDMYILRSIMDSLHTVNPLKSSETLSWMVTNTFRIPNSGLSYTPPAGTVLTYRMILLPGLSWQDGRQVTGFDVAFSYLSLLANGAPQSSGASPLSGITVLGPRQFDLHVNSAGTSTELQLTGLTILPARYWTCGTGPQPSIGVAPAIAPVPCPAGANNWDISVMPCTATTSSCYPIQYTLGTAPAAAACYPAAPSPCAPPAIYQFLSVDPSIKFVDSPPAMAPNAPGTWTPGKTITYDSDNSGTVTGSDIIISGTPPAIGTNLSVDPDLKFVDKPPASTPNAIGTWAIGKGVIHDTSGDGMFQTGNPGIQDTLITPTGFSTGFPTSPLNADATKVDATYDPIANHILIGSSAWSCGTGPGLGQACAPGNVQNPAIGQAYTLQRIGRGTAPSFNGDYIRGSGKLALWIWSGDRGVGANDAINFSIAKACFGLPPVPLRPVPLTSDCAHWQQGIGTNGATTTNASDPSCPAGSTCGIRVGAVQLSIVAIYYGLNWVSPDDWASTPPQGIIPLNPTLYAGNAPNPLPAGYPVFIPGGEQTLAPASLAGCSSPYPIGGYDC